MARLQVGDPAPPFTLPAADGTTVSLSDYAGRRVIVYFYPAASTPGCTTQAVDFTASADAIAAAGFDVLGISPDAVAKLAGFREKEALTITLLADPERTTLEAYGAWGTKLLYGKEITGVLRSTFVVDVDETGAGTISVAQYNVRATGHVAKLRRDLGIA
ncbi:peroxiredoxin [Propioniciclava soli]|uniref:peroxiredoxin n=1 Tax=Propioniciclava soli TaxID=2775081 RepID=UPI001E5E703B|nr:peroxiredoxin [Propioniciclava soli]